MDVNRFYTDIYERIMGLDVLGLEDRFRDLTRLIDEKTLPTFSQYVPAIYRTYLDLQDRSKIIPKKDHHTLGVEYYIDDPVLDKFKLNILGLEDIQVNNPGIVDPYDPDSSAYYSSIIAARSNLTLEGMLMGAEYTYDRTLMDTAVPYKRYQKLVGPRTIYLQNWAMNSTVELYLKVKWPNIVSVPEEYKEPLTTLAILDIKMYLWNSLKFIPQVQLPNGSLELRIDDYENAYREREDFLKELRRQSLPDRVGNHFFQIL